MGYTKNAKDIPLSRQLQRGILGALTKSQIENLDGKCRDAV